jgi:hypothetical protein
MFKKILISVVIVASTHTFAASQQDMAKLTKLSTTTSIKGLDLSGADLRSYKFDPEKTNLQNANLSHANLSNVDLSKMDLTNTNLSHANLTNAKYRKLKQKTKQHKPLFGAPPITRPRPRRRYHPKPKAIPLDFFRLNLLKPTEIFVINPKYPSLYHQPPPH